MSAVPGDGLSYHELEDPRAKALRYVSLRASRTPPLPWFSSELGHYKVFLRLAQRVSGRKAAQERWQEMLILEAGILANQAAGPRIHSGFAAEPSAYPARRLLALAAE